MEKRLDRLEEKLDKTMDHMGAMATTLAAQHVTLQEHMRRSEANERAVEMLKMQLTPINEHVIRVKGIGRFLAYSVSFIATVIGIIAYFK